MRPARLALLLAAGLTGCQSTTPAGDATAPTAPSVASSPTSSADANAETTVALAPANDAVLEGMDQPALQRRFGAPALSRRDGDAVVLAYKFDDCVLHLFLYPRAGDGLRVRHAAAIGTDRRTRPAAACRP